MRETGKAEIFACTMTGCNLYFYTLKIWTEFDRKRNISEIAYSIVVSVRNSN